MIRVTFRYSCYTVSCPLAKGWTAKTSVPLGEVQVKGGGCEIRHRRWWCFEWCLLYFPINPNHSKEKRLPFKVVDKCGANGVNCAIFIVLSCNISLVSRFLFIFKKHPSSFHVIHHPPESHQSPTFLALETRGLRILIVALSSIILHLVSALVIPLLAAWWSFGGEAKNPCGLGELDIADDLELIPEGCHKIGSDKW